MRWTLKSPFRVFASAVTTRPYGRGLGSASWPLAAAAPPPCPPWRAGPAGLSDGAESVRVGGRCAVCVGAGSGEGEGLGCWEQATPKRMAAAAGVSGRRLGRIRVARAWGDSGVGPHDSVWSGHNANAPKVRVVGSFVIPSGAPKARSRGIETLPSRGLSTPRAGIPHAPRGHPRPAASARNDSRGLTTTTSSPARTSR